MNWARNFPEFIRFRVVNNFVQVVWVQFLPHKWNVYIVPSLQQICIRIEHSIMTIIRSLCLIFYNFVPAIFTHNKTLNEIYFVYLAGYYLTPNDLACAGYFCTAILRIMFINMVIQQHICLSNIIIYLIFTVFSLLQVSELIHFRGRLGGVLYL